jgi:Na+-translocating ferredoxin:NAD+ oxidoreductase subunit D
LVDNAKGLIVSSAPHLKGDMTTAKAMKDVLIALLPVTLVAVYFFQTYALFLVTVCLVTAALTEVLFRKLMKKKVTLHDYSALVTGLLVALCFSATTEWWKGALATFIAIGVAKELMGGLGWNRFNPALFGRISLIVLAPWFVPFNAGLSAWSVNLGRIDTISQGTPLAMLKQGMPMPALGQLFAWYPAGAMAEVSALAVLLGGLYLIYKKHIKWHIPASIMATVFVLTLIAGQNPFYHLVTGGLMLGAFFMATDWVTSPITDKGKIIFGVAMGVLIVVFRVGLAATEGVGFSILIMNAFVPMIEKATRRASFSAPKPVSLPTMGKGTPVSK